MDSRVICIQSSPANTVTWAPVNFTAHFISSAFSKIEVKQQWQNHTTTKPTNPKQNHKETKINTPSPQPNSWFVPVFSYSNTALCIPPAWMAWTKGPETLGSEPQSLSTVPIPRQVSRRQARWKTKERSCEIFQCAYETGQRTAARGLGAKGRMAPNLQLNTYVHIKQEWTAKTFSLM